MASIAPEGLTAMACLWEKYRNVTCVNPVCTSGWLDEFFFCLLGGFGIPYELNLSAFNVLKLKGCLERDFFYGPREKARVRLESELRTPQFTPLCRNGKPRVYRFYRRKADILLQAGCWLADTCDFSIANLLTHDPRHNREVLRECPGFGYKTASWFLRNIGMGTRLAIIDVHVHRVLSELGIIPPDTSISSDYLYIENRFLEACDMIGAEAGRMDLVLWTWARGGISER